MNIYRRKKVRCSGERPTCSYCDRLNQDCHYLEEGNWIGSDAPLHRPSAPYVRILRPCAARSQLLTSPSPLGGPVVPGSVTGSKGVATQPLRGVSVVIVIHCHLLLGVRANPSAQLYPSIGECFGSRQWSVSKSPHGKDRIKPV